MAGLAAANAFMSIGVRVTVLERRLEPAAAGLALNLPGNAVAALHKLGLEEELRSLGRTIDRREYRTAEGKLLFAIDEKGFWPDTSPSMAVTRKDLLHLLTERLPLDAVRLAADVRAIDERNAHIEVTTGTGERFTGALLVGADGVNGPTRGMLGLGTSTRSLIGNASWRFTADNPGVDCWTTWASADAIALLMPISSDKVYGWVMISDMECADPETITLRIRGFPDVVRTAFSAAATRGRLHHSPLQDVRLTTWSKGRSILIGDAAHASAPVWAQGAAMAIEDAVVLAEIFEERGRTNIARLFEQRRLPRVGHVQRMTDHFSRAARLPTPLRNFLMPLIGPVSYRRTYRPLRESP